MNVLLRGLCERLIDDMLDNSLIQEYSGLLKELDIPEESRGCFLMGYMAGIARSRLNACSLTISNRALNGDEIEVFSEILGRRMDDLLENIFDHEIENYAKEVSVIEEPRLAVSREFEETSNEEKIEEIPLKTVATIGKPKVEEEKFSDEKIEEIPLKTVATIGKPKVEEEKFSFKISGRKKSPHSILGIPVRS